MNIGKLCQASEALRIATVREMHGETEAARIHAREAMRLLLAELQSASDYDLAHKDGRVLTETWVRDADQRT